MPAKVYNRPSVFKVTILLADTRLYFPLTDRQTEGENNNRDRQADRNKETERETETDRETER